MVVDAQILAYAMSAGIQC